MEGKHVSGKLNYTNPKIWRVAETGDVVLIVPTDPWRILTFIWAFFPTFVAAGVVIGYWLFKSERATIILLGISAIIPMFVICMFLTWMYRREIKLGPWFAFDKKTGNITLPRQSITVDREHVEGWQIVTGFNPLPYAEWSQVAELQLIVRDGDGVQHQYPLLGAVDERHIKEEVKKLSSATGIPTIE